MSSRILATSETQLKKYPLPSDHVISEHFDTGLMEFPNALDVNCGLWDHPDGESRYVESDEVFAALMKSSRKRRFHERNKSVAHSNGGNWFLHCRLR